MLLTTPASTSAWVIVRCAVAVQVVDAPGASVVTGQVTAPAIGSLIARVVSVTVPVFLTRNDHWILSPRSVSPSLLTSVTAADLVSCRAEVWTTGVVVDDGAVVIVAPLGWVAPAVAVLATEPASTSAWVIVYGVVAVQVVDAPGRQRRDRAGGRRRPWRR